MFGSVVIYLGAVLSVTYSKVLKDTKVLSKYIQLLDGDQLLLVC
jgi:hypothetical protein